MPEWRAVRAEFPPLERWTYLNTATFGQMPRRATEAVARHFEHRDELACSDFLSWYGDADRIRELVAQLIHSHAEDIAFVPNVAAALAIVMTGIEWKPGDRIVTLEDEFPDSIYWPALASASNGIEFVEAPWDRFYESIDERTRLVVLSEVNYVTGFRPPAAEVARRAHEAGALFFLDGTQSLGALTFDVNTVQPDIYAVHGYKWLLSPTGAAFAYVSPAVRDRLRPSVIGWRSHREWRSVDNLHHGAPELAGAAEKYEGGMLTFPVLYAMAASVEMFLELGPDAVEARALGLARCTRDALRGLGAFLPSDASPHFNSAIVAARFSVPASPLARSLKERGVLVSARHDYLRVSTHFYNAEEDVARLVEELRELL